jgi:hypothetical protein
VRSLLVRLLGPALAAGLLAGAVACNGLLGIGPASLEEDAGGDAGGDAGPSPGALTCDHYCDVVLQNCTGANAEYLGQMARQTCLAMCPAFEVSSAIADTADNSLGCRLFFANQAASTPDVSCRFAGPLGGGHCGNDPCTSFCALDVQYCSVQNGNLPVAYDGGLAECMGDCSGSNGYPYLVVDAGDTTLDSKNTLNCRLWHLESAFAGHNEGIFHCPHTEKVSTTCF